MNIHTTSAPVAPTDRVSDVLARDESLVDVFVRLSPHFAKLRNRAMRRVMGRLVTIEQAARIAGIPAGLLVRDLNDALGIADPATEAAEPCAAPVARASGDAARVHPPNAPVVDRISAADVTSVLNGNTQVQEAKWRSVPGSERRH